MSTKTFRAVCKNNDYKGPWRTTQDEATEDALDHQGEKPHVVRIEVSQTVEIRKFIDI